MFKDFRFASVVQGVSAQKNSNFICVENSKAIRLRGSQASDPFHRLFSERVEHRGRTEERQANCFGSQQRRETTTQ
jgi:hypothetical protein